MKIKINKELILSRLKSVKNFNKDVELADYLGISPTTLANWYSRNSIDFDVLFSKCEQDDISVEYIITGKEQAAPAQPATIGVPLYDVSAAAGFNSFDEMINSEKLLGNFTIPGFKNIDWMIYVVGSSMYPKYSSGDIIGCRVLRESRFIQWGKVYVIATREQGILVKRLKKSQEKDCIKAVPDNPNYDSFDIPNDEILGIALVVGVIRLE